MSEYNNEINLFTSELYVTAWKKDQFMFFICSHGCVGAMREREFLALPNRKINGAASWYWCLQNANWLHKSHFLLQEEKNFMLLLFLDRKKKNSSLREIVPGRLCWWIIFNDVLRKWKIFLPSNMHPKKEKKCLAKH